MLSPDNTEIKRIFLFGRTFSPDFSENFRLLVSKLHQYGINIVMFEPFYNFANGILGEKLKVEGLFNHTGDLEHNESIMLSVGGDGTFLEAITLVRDLPIAIAGINSGRLGFLADIAQEEIAKALDAIVQGQYTTDKRTLLQLSADRQYFGDFNIALNEVTVHKRDDSSMISIHAYLDDQYLNSYWADGLIVATPTGSTAYSLSVGGPLVLPGCDDFILAPIAPHNLTVRPLVYPDGMKLTLTMEGRSGHIMVSLDSRSVVMDSSIELRICKAPYRIKTLRLMDHLFYNTLRSKLMWGADSRN